MVARIINPLTVPRGDARYYLWDGTGLILRLPSDTVDTTEKNLRYNTTDKRPEYYDGSKWVPMGIPKMIKVSEAGVTEGNNSISGFTNKANIKLIHIETTSTNWSLTIYEDGAYSASPKIAMAPGGVGNKDIYLDHLYEDQDVTAELHYNFTSASGAETHYIEVRALELQ